MLTKVKILILAVLFVGVTSAPPPECMVRDVCTDPKPTESLDFVWVKENAPADGWHMDFGNKVVRLHIAELIQNEVLTYEDDYSDMCGRLQLSHAAEGTDGVYSGFGGKTVDFHCTPSEKDRHIIECDYSHTELEKYTEKKVQTYVTYTDNKNVMVAIKCFPNGESGWHSLSKTTSLTQDERNQVLNHVKALGYDNKDVVPMFNETCNEI